MEIQTLANENLDANGIIEFAPTELKYFKLELDKQFEEGKGINILKAIRNARYLSMLDKSFKELEEGKVVSFTDEEWEAFVNAQDLH